MKRHVKIVCTMGPASSSPEVVESMLKGGMDVARFNMAHGTLKEHSQLISEVRSLSQKLDLPVGILLDLPGLKLSRGDIKAVFGQHLDFALTGTLTLLPYLSSPQCDRYKRLSSYSEK